MNILVITIIGVIAICALIIIFMIAYNCDRTDYDLSMAKLKLEWALQDYCKCHVSNKTKRCVCGKCRLIDTKSKLSDIKGKL